MRWWPSARDEVRAMAHALPLMYLDEGTPLAPLLFSTDAQGAFELITGYGFAAREPKMDMIQHVF